MSKKRALIVDDNDFYALKLQNYFENLDFQIDRAYNVKNAWKLYNKSKGKYSLLVTDITMETQISGLHMLKKLNQKQSFKGIIIVTSTGFDFPGILYLSKFILPFIGVHWLIPKKNLKQDQKVNIVGTTLRKSKVFEEEINSC